MFRKNIIYKSLTIIFVITMLSGCTSMKAVVAMTKSTEHFITLDENTAIRYEKGSKEFAIKIAPQFEKSIQTIELKQYGKFPEKVFIYIPSSIDSFSSYCASKLPSACVIGGKVFISPKLLNSPDRILGILIHELSHLQLSQFIGRWDYHRNVPVWFSEGLAVYVSDGGGAEKVERSEAVKAIKAGKAIVPNGSGSLLFSKTASSFNLKPHMFYRQSSLYVEWLHHQNTEHFKQLIGLLHNGNILEEAMMKSYGFTVLDGWHRFTSEIET